MFSKARVLSVIAAATMASAIGGGVAAPASAATTTAARQGHQLSVVEAPAPARAGAAIQALPCSAGVQVDAFSILFDCVFDRPTNVSARCSDGFVFPARTVPAGPRRIYVDCFPARFSSLILT